MNVIAADVAKVLEYNKYIMDELEYIKKLAGVNEFKGYTEYTLENMSHSASEIKKIEKEKNIKPGDKEWFALWFNLPYMTGALNQKPGFRGRTK